MKILPDYKGRNDEFDENTIRYWEEIDEDGYFYELYILADGEQAAVIIMDNGVHLDYRAGNSIHTNIVPGRLFPNQKELKWSQIAKILSLLEKTDAEGMGFSKTEMDRFYKKWLELGKP